VTDLGSHYRRSRQRLDALVREAGPSGWATPVEACPGGAVGDVVAHLVANIEHGLAGRLDGTGPPDPDQTDEQVMRHRGDEPHELLDRWDELGPPFEAVLSEVVIWPAVLDVVTHEHDVRAALDRPGARDDDLVEAGARLLVEGLDVGATITADLGDQKARSSEGAGPALGLRTSAFEVLRFRLGRRSRDQVAALDWTGDPAPVLDQLFVFGPRPDPFVE